MKDMPSIDIPGYEFKEVLGQGGMATVYLGMQKSVQRLVAIKIISHQLSQDPVFGERFLREARIVSQLVHPNIVTVYDAGVIDNQHYLVMEYIKGDDLKCRLNQLSLTDMLEVVKDVAAALEYAGKKGFAHRDIKPENIMLHDEDGRAVLTDFGIARAFDAVSAMTNTGTIVGTPHYMSPEQAISAKVDHRSDLYSLGVVLYRMLVGKVPFDGDSSVSIGIKHISEPIPSVSPYLSETFQPIINKLLAKKPEERWSSGKELIDALAQIPAEILAKLSEQREQHKAQRAKLKRMGAEPRNNGKEEATRIATPTYLSSQSQRVTPNDDTNLEQLATPTPDENIENSSVSIDSVSIDNTEHFGATNTMTTSEVGASAHITEITSTETSSTETPRTELTSTETTPAETMVTDTTFSQSETHTQSTNNLSGNTQHPQVADSQQYTKELEIPKVSLSEDERHQHASEVAVNEASASWKIVAGVALAIGVGVFTLHYLNVVDVKSVWVNLINNSHADDKQAGNKHTSDKQAPLLVAQQKSELSQQTEQVNLQTAQQVKQQVNQQANYPANAINEKADISNQPTQMTTTAQAPQNKESTPKSDSGEQISSLANLLAEAEALRANKAELLANSEALLAVYQDILMTAPDNGYARTGIASLKSDINALVANHESAARFTEAVQAHNQLRELFPTFGQDTAYAERHQQLLRHQKIAELMQTAEELIAKDYLSGAGQRSAMHYIDQVLSIHPAHFEALAAKERIISRYHQLGIWALQKGEFEKAKTYSDKALAVNYGEQAHLLELEQQIISAEQAATAANEAEQAITAKINQGYEHIENGRLLQPEFENAFDVFNEVLAQQENQPEALAGMQTLELSLNQKVMDLLAAGELSEAEQLALAAAKKFPTSLFIAEAQNEVLNEIERVKPKITKLVIMGQAFDDIASESGDGSDIVPTENAVFIGLEYSNFPAASAVLQAELYDDAKATKLTTVPVLLADQQGETYFKVTGPLQGFNEGSYILDILLGQETLSSREFLIQR
ncbi:serine/threonine protein kinase [Thalassotalea euphylliae]|uniref:non-specific serine/threonine protein kinase n=1 Tax=Thalassotalea euphylliae TaxID=1655234 RepID=A0A3E0TSS6_9GAMM|nr:serine/threonine-protein kinase [Thalassotalea euphylliae]REL27696.1 serine/threonine protein kinase [Thalassotalea euphylliae]